MITAVSSAGLDKRGVLMFGAVRQGGTGIALTGGAVAAAVFCGVGVAHAAPADDVVDVVPSGTATGSGADVLGPYTAMWDQAAQQMLASNSPADLLSTATTNFTDAGNVLNGIDIDGSDLSSQLQQSVTATIASQTNALGSFDGFVGDNLSPAETAILAHSGSLTSLVDQLFLDPLNQQWVDVSETLLSASNALDTGVAAGLSANVEDAVLQLLGTEFFQGIPTVLASAPIIFFGDLLGGAAGDMAAATPDLFDLPF